MDPTPDRDFLYRRHEKQPLRPQINVDRVHLVSRSSHNGAYLIL